MDFYKLPEYVELEKELDKNIKLGVNFIFSSFEGYSISYFLKKYMEKKPKNVSYIDQAGIKLSKYNILDFDFCVNPDALTVIEEHIKSAKLDQKFAVVINDPSIFDKDDYKNSYIGVHHYSTYHFKKPSLEYVKTYTKDMKVEFNNEDINNIYELSGGIGRLVKFLIVNRSLIDLPVTEIINNKSIVDLITPVIKVIQNSNELTLNMFGVKNNDKFTSKIIETYFIENNISIHPQIIILKDLTVNENGENKERLNKIEAMVLQSILDNDGLIEKAKVADLKWGDGSYDQYSDQAIAKTILRINRKLTYYKIVAIPKYGYKIISIN
jgi:hypothetical protein